MQTFQNRFTRYSFDVVAERATEENMLELALWCGGIIAVNDGAFPDRSEHYIQVPVRRARNFMQTMAFAGDWIVRFGNSFKVYTDEAFKRDFHGSAKTPEERRSAIYDLVRSAMAKQDAETYHGNSARALPYADEITNKILELF